MIIMKKNLRKYCYDSLFLNIKIQDNKLSIFKIQKIVFGWGGTSTLAAALSRTHVLTTALGETSAPPCFCSLVSSEIGSNSCLLAERNSDTGSEPLTGSKHRRVSISMTTTTAIAAVLLSYVPRRSMQLPLGGHTTGGFPQ